MPDPPQTSFAHDATGHLRDLRAALTDLLGSTVPGSRPAEIARELGIDKTLAWKLSRFVEDADPIKAAKHMPGPGGVEIVLRAAGLKGVADGRVEAVRGADARLRAFMKERAGDRRTFEAMISAGEERGGDADFEARRELFRAGSAIWGVRGRVQLLTIALRPSEDEPTLLDAIQVGGLVDFERLRGDVPWIVRRLRASNDSESEMIRIRREPLDPRGVRGPGTLPLMPDFCSHPLPELRQFEGVNGWVYDELAPGDIGRRAAVTCVTGEKHLAVLPAERSEENTAGRYTLTVRTPVEAVVFDLLLHKSLDHFGAAQTRVFGLLEDRPHAGGAAANAHTLYEPAPSIELGHPAVVQTPRLAGYSGLVERALELAGWGGPGHFRGYRTEMEYPPAPCDFTMVCQIGER